MKNEQLELFSTNYAEAGNANQLFRAPGEEPLAGQSNTDGCSFDWPNAGEVDRGVLWDFSKKAMYWGEGGDKGNAWGMQEKYIKWVYASTTSYYFWSGSYGYNSNPVRCCLPAFTSSPALPFPVFTLSREQLLVDLFRAYYDARRHKRNTRNQLAFEINLEENLVALCDELLARTYKVGRSACFVIEKPEKREIFTVGFRDRVVHHLVYNYLSPFFERIFIPDSYACRKGKGTLYGVHRLAHHIRSCSRNYTYACYVLKMDIRGYFMHIRRNRLYEICQEELLKFVRRPSDTGQPWGEKLDYGLLFYLLGELILTDPLQNCVRRGKESDWEGMPPDKSMFRMPAGCGLPMGNLTSQLFSNIYLHRLDRFVKRELGAAHYGRYVDDFYIVHENKALLKLYLAQIGRFLQEELGLSLHPDKTALTDARYGVSYLGVLVKPYRLYVDNRTKRRMFCTTGGLAGCRDAERLRASINSYLGYLRQFKSRRLRERMFECRDYWRPYGFFDGHYRKFQLYKKETPPEETAGMAAGRGAGGASPK